MAATGMMDFVQRFQNLQIQRESSEILIQDLIDYAKRIENALREENLLLRNNLHNAKLDLDDSTKSRRELQHRAAELEKYAKSAYQEIESLKSRNPYVVIFIDGDGLIFQESLIRLGNEGGKKAALTLRAAAMEILGEKHVDYEIIARVICNLSGLGRAMKRDGCLDSEGDFKDFTLGFTQVKASFDFVDVGYGKERADAKLKELTRWHLKNVNCKFVFLGISHDAGYAPFLDEILQDDEVRRRVAVIEGFPSVRELIDTKVNILKMSAEIFRTEKLVDRVATYTQAPIAPPVLSTVSPPPATSAVAGPPLISSSVPNSYAGAILKASPPPQITLPLQIKPSNNSRAKPTPPPVTWNPGPRGLDPPIPINQTVLETIKKRKDNNKLCNNHYLRGPCAKGEVCCFEHNYKPSQDELNAIAYLARQNPCTNGQDCEAEDCIYGHHCPNTSNGVCQHPYCKFRVEEHPPGTKFRNPKPYESY